MPRNDQVTRQWFLMQIPPYLSIFLFLVAALCVSGCAKINRAQLQKSIGIQTARRQYVHKAYQKASESITRRAAGFSTFINLRKSGVHPLSEDLVSLYGRWRAARPYLSFTDKEGHQKYVEEKFEQHIFTEQDLEAALKEAIKRSEKDIESIENELAVTLERELRGQFLSPDGGPITAEAFKRIVERMVAATQRDIAKYPAGLVIEKVAEKITKRVLVRLGVSAGILTAGAANSGWSLGASLVIGMVVDQIWEWIDDPAGDIEREIIAALDKLSQDASTAIEEEMNRELSQRRELWDKAAMKLYASD